jgi:hypothetical protein
MAAYTCLTAAAMSNRVAYLGAVPFSVADFDELLDMPRMRDALKGLNMVWVTDKDAKNDPEVRALVAAAGPRTQIPDLARNIPYGMLPWSEYEMYLMGGDPMMKSWPAYGWAYQAARLDVLQNMSDTGFLFMNPFQVLGYMPLKRNLPFSTRFFFRHTVFHRRIRDMAQELMSSIRARNVTKLMVVHLRIEWDGPERDQPKSPEFLRAAFAEQMGGLANRSGVDGIYIICGDMSRANEMALRNYTGVPVMFKFDFPNIVFPVKDDEKGKQNPFASAVHALIAAHSSVYVITTTHSTFLNVVSSMRCRPPIETTKLTRQRFRDIYEKPQTPVVMPDAAQLVEPAPGVGLPEEELDGEPPVSHQLRGYGRNFVYWRKFVEYSDIECPGS